MNGIVCAAAATVGLALMTLPPPGGAAPATAATIAPRPVGVVLVRSLSWPEAQQTARRVRGPVAAGLISTLPADAPMAARVLSLAAGFPVDADALRDGVTAASVVRLRAANPALGLAGLAPVRVVAIPDMQVAGLFALGDAAVPPLAERFMGPEKLGPATHGRLTVVALDGWAPLIPVLRALGANGDRILVVGLVAGKDRARTSAYLDIGNQAGVVTSSSTHTPGIIALEDLRATLAGRPVANGAPAQVVARPAPLHAVERLDEQVGALVRARRWAQVLAALLGILALGGSLLALVHPRLRSVVRLLLLLTIALPSGYLVASRAGPPSALLWLSLAVGATGALALGGLRAGASAPAWLGAALLWLVTLDLFLGSDGLSRPLLGNSAFDGERYYGLGNGYLAYAVSALAVVLAFWPIPRWAATAAFIALALIAGLPSLGADVGGTLAAMLGAVTAWIVLAPQRPSVGRVLAALGGAIAGGLVLALGLAAAAGVASNNARFIEHVRAAGAGPVIEVAREKLARNAGLLTQNPWAWCGPLEVCAAAIACLRPTWLPAWLPAPSVHVLRAVVIGVAASAAVLALNDTGVTAVAASGLLLLVALSWAALSAA